MSALLRNDEDPDPHMVLSTWLSRVAAALQVVAADGARLYRLVVQGA